MARFISLYYSAFLWTTWIAVTIANQFIDDRNQVHILNGPPRIISSATTAVSLLHLGMPKEYLLGVWGSPYGSYSNSFEGGGGVSQYHSMDASKEDMTILRGIPTFTPGCYDDHSKCWTDYEFSTNRYDYDAVRALRGSDVNMVIDVSNLNRHLEIVVNASQILNIPIITIDDSWDGGDNCHQQVASPNSVGQPNDLCYTRTYLDVVNRIHQLAVWMGIDVSAAEDGRYELCQAAEKLHEALEYAQTEGIRFLLASVGEGGDWVQGMDPSDGDQVVFVANPLAWPTSRSFEELGMSVLWPGKCPTDNMFCWQWGPLPVGMEILKLNMFFPDCLTGDSVNANCASNPLYPVDFWILEGQSYQSYSDNPTAFTAQFPDRAMLADQVMAWPTEPVFSYQAAAGYYTALADKILSSRRLHPRTTCIDAHVTSTAHINYGAPSLGGGEYACFNTEYHNQDYLTCPVRGEDPSLSMGGIVGIIIGSVIGGALIMYVIMKFVLGYRTGIDHNYKEEENHRNIPSAVKEDHDTASGLDDGSRSHQSTSMAAAAVPNSMTPLEMEEDDA